MIHFLIFSTTRPIVFCQILFSHPIMNLGKITQFLVIFISRMSDQSHPIYRLGFVGSLSSDSLLLSTTSLWLGKLEVGRRQYLLFCSSSPAFSVLSPSMLVTERTEGMQGKIFPFLSVTAIMIIC